MLQGGPPTVELLRPVGPDIPSDERVFQVLDFCLQVGEVLLSSGEAAADTSATMTRLAHACGLATVEIDITFTSISMCCRRGRSVAPVTSMRVVRFRTTDLTRLASVTRIVDQVVRGEIALPAAEAALVKAVGARHPYPRWLATVGWAGLAAAVALLLGGGPMIWLTAFVVTALIDRIGRLLSRWGVPPFFLQIVGGFVATLSTLGLLAAGALPPATDPSLVVAASITVLLSGLSLMGAVQDAISGHPVTAAGRAVEIALLSAGLLTGVIIALKVGIGFELSLDPGEPVAADVTRFGISTLAAAAAAALSALAGYAPLRSSPPPRWPAASAGPPTARSPWLTSAPWWPPGLAAVLIGLASEIIDRRYDQDRPARDRPVRDHPAVARAHRVPRLLPAGLRAGRGGRPGHHHPRARHRPRPRRRSDVRPVHRRPRPATAAG